MSARARARIVKIRLFHKILASIVLILFLMVTVLAVIVQLVVYRSFANYVTTIELGEVDGLAKALEAQYKRDGSWARLKSDRSQWRRLIESYLPETRARSRAGTPPPPREFEHGRAGTPPPGPPPEPPPWGPPDRRPWPPPDRRPHRPIQPPGLPGRSPEGPPEEQGRRFGQPPPPGPHPANALFIGPRLTLFDGDKRQVAGHGVSTEGHKLRPLLVNGKTIGYLGIIPVDHLSHPLTANFLRQQARAFYLAGLAVFVVGVIIAFLLSRHLSAPIRKLALATRELASFRFDTRIDVYSKDELGQLAADFNTMTQRLKEYEHMREQWISDISHELRTPLAILKGEIEALQDGIRHITPERLNSLHAEVSRMAKLVDDLHVLSMADSQNLAQRKQPVPIAQTLRATLYAFAHRLEQAGIELEMNVSDGDETTVLGDEDRLAQLFSNLVENTIRYTDSPGTLRVSLIRSREVLTVVFEDTAPGAPADALGRLFDRLYRVDKSRSRILGGSGLGLSICRGIVDAHNGHIRAENSPLGGIRITIDLPVVPG